MSFEIVVPELGESIVEATVTQWLKQEGDAVSIGDVLVELETEKVNLEVAAEHDGILSSIKRSEGEDVEIGDVLGIIEEGEAAGDESPEDKTSDSDSEAEEETPAKEEEGKATPMAKRLAEEHNLNLNEIPREEGSRLTKEDVNRYLESQKEETKKPPKKEESKKPAKSKPTPQKREEKPTSTSPSERSEERIRMSRRRQTIARRLVEAQQNAAMLTTFNEIDMSAVMDLRKRRRNNFQERHGVKLGFMSFFVKAVIGALKKFPPLNAEIDGNEMVLKHYYDIGMAVGAEEGLVVPVLRNADRLSFAEIEEEIVKFVEKAQNGTLSLEDLRGGTFTITNGGVFGSLLSTPILNPPQVGILGLHKIEKRPIVLDDEVVVRPMMYVALSYDHRIVDGREAVQFLAQLKTLMEDPELLLLEG